MYGLMVAFEPTRATPVDGGGRNESLNLGNVVVDSKTTGDGDHGGDGGKGINLEYWHCGWKNLNRNCT